MVTDLPFEGRKIEGSRKYSRNESANSDIGSEYQLSDLDKRNDFVGFENDAGVLSAEEEEISDEEG